MANNAKTISGDIAPPPLALVVVPEDAVELVEELLEVEVLLEVETGTVGTDVVWFKVSVVTSPAGVIFLIAALPVSVT